MIFGDRDYLSFLIKRRGFERSQAEAVPEGAETGAQSGRVKTSPATRAGPDFRSSCAVRPLFRRRFPRSSLLAFRGAPTRTCRTVLRRIWLQPSLPAVRRTGRIPNRGRRVLFRQSRAVIGCKLYLCPAGLARRALCSVPLVRCGKPRVPLGVRSTHLVIPRSECHSSFWAPLRRASSRRRH